MSLELLGKPAVVPGCRTPRPMASSRCSTMSLAERIPLETLWAYVSADVGE